MWRCFSTRGALKALMIHWCSRKEFSFSLMTLHWGYRKIDLAIKCDCVCDCTYVHACMHVSLLEFPVGVMTKVFDWHVVLNRVRCDLKSYCTIESNVPLWHLKGLTSVTVFWVSCFSICNMIFSCQMWVVVTFWKGNQTPRQCKVMMMLKYCN